MNAVVSSAWGPITMDATDLAALVAVAAGVLYLRAPPRTVTVALGWRDAGRAVGVALAGIATLATTAPRLQRNYPAWRVLDPTIVDVGCAELSPFVVKSGKEGAGATLVVRPHTPACDAAREVRRPEVRRARPAHVDGVDLRRRAADRDEPVACPVRRILRSTATRSGTSGKAGRNADRGGKVDSAASADHLRAAPRLDRSTQEPVGIASR